jgi:putative tryptophan/tyrosine transport system substrate-binding protein
MFTFKFYVEAGGLMSYGVDTEPLYRRGAAYVAKILRGAKASDLPVEQATNFELTVNLKTAKAAGFTLPTNVCFWHKADIQPSLSNVRFWG